MPELAACTIRQAAALAIRDGKVCMVTSSNGKRWVIPKGLIEPGQTAGETALQEAWEEAGLVGLLQPAPLGSYLYEKYASTYHVTVFLMDVTDIAENWPERNLRQRAWFDLDAAVARIDEATLGEIVRAAFAKDLAAL